MRLPLALLLTFATSLPARAAVRHAPRHHWQTLACGGGTVDVVLSVATSVCFDRRGRRYVATYAGGGWGGIVALSAFTFSARLRPGHDVAGHYTGTSTSLAFRWGAGAGFFKRNDGGDFKPTPSSDEYLIWLAVHRGYAFDVSGLTLVISRR